MWWISKHLDMVDKNSGTILCRTGAPVWDQEKPINPPPPVQEHAVKIRTRTHVLII